MAEPMNPVYEVLRNIKQVQTELKKKVHGHFKNLELTAPQGMTLFTLSHHGSLKISEISEKMGLSNSTISGIVDRLEAQSLVERVRSKEDRRVVYVSLTKETKEMLSKHEDVMDQWVGEALAYASEEELNQILEGLEILNRLLNRVSEGDEKEC